jgi:site-specific DNA-methyltransferase (adenine-specific)
MTLELNRIYNMDCLQWMRDAPENCIDAIVTDPPYALTTTKRWKDTDQFAQNQSDVGKRFSKGFMGKEWDGSIPGIEIWQEVLRVSKPGAHMLAFGGTRTHHRLMVAIEDAGWEIRDCLMWVYGSGFPKSLDVSKAIDKAEGVEREVIGEYKHPDGKPRNWEEHNQSNGEIPYGHDRGMARDITMPATDSAKQWNGWGTALKPAWEPIILCRKPLSEKTVAANVQKWGTGAINIDACRIDGQPWKAHFGDGLAKNKFFTDGERTEYFKEPHNKGRFPANLIHDGSDEVLALFPETGAANIRNPNGNDIYGRNALNQSITKDTTVRGFIDNGGSAARFFYTAKADSTERNKYLKGKPMQKVNDGRETPIDNPFQRGETLRKNIHPTVKPIDLLQYLARLITPPKGTILDPFAGSGSTGVAAFNEGFNYILIEIEKEYAEIAKMRNAQVRL